MKALVSAGLALVVAAVGLGVSQSTDDTRPPRKQDAGSMGTEFLIEGLLAEEGCLGVETAWTQSRKGVIFAWFQDKDAALSWYYSAAHQKAVEMFITEEAGGDHEPLAHVPDDCGPILTVATITPSDKPSVPGVAMPVRQIAIELYTPLPGGLSFGGTFAPARLKIPHHVYGTLETDEEGG